MSDPKKLGSLAGGGGAAGAAGCVRCWGLRSPQWEQWVRRCAAPGQTQWSGLQGRAVCGSRWRIQRGHAVAGGWPYLWGDAGLGAWGLVVRACWWVRVRCLSCSRVPCRCCAWWTVLGLGGVPRRVVGRWLGSHGWYNRSLRSRAWSAGVRVAACCRYLWVRYVSCFGVLATDVRCMCAAVAPGLSAWVRSMA